MGPRWNNSFTIESAARDDELKPEERSTALQCTSRHSWPAVLAIPANAPDSGPDPAPSPVNPNVPSSRDTVRRVAPPRAADRSRAGPTFRIIRNASFTNASSPGPSGASTINPQSRSSGTRAVDSSSRIAWTSRSRFRKAAQTASVNCVPSDVTQTMPSAPKLHLLAGSGILQGADDRMKLADG